MSKRQILVPSEVAAAADKQWRAEWKAAVKSPETGVAFMARARTEFHGSTARGTVAAAYAAHYATVGGYLVDGRKVDEATRKAQGTKSSQEYAAEWEVSNTLVGLWQPLGHALAVVGVEGGTELFSALAFRNGGLAQRGPVKKAILADGATVDTVTDAVTAFLAAEQKKAADAADAAEGGEGGESGDGAPGAPEVGGSLSKRLEMLDALVAALTADLDKDTCTDATRAHVREAATLLIAAADGKQVESKVQKTA